MACKSYNDNLRGPDSLPTIKTLDAAQAARHGDRNLVDPDAPLCPMEQLSSPNMMPTTT